MSCNQTDFTRGIWPLDYGDPGGPVDAHAHAEKPLILSNSPEEIDKDLYDLLPRTLYRCEVPIGPTTKRIRAYVWHSNKSGSPVDIVAMVSTSTAVSATIFNIAIEGAIVSDTNLTALGICTAKAQLFETLTGVLGSISVGTSEVALRSDNVGNDLILGYVVEFDVQASSATNLRFRTSASQVNGSRGSWNTVVATATTHPRGWWPHSDLEAYVGTFDATPTIIPNLKLIACCKNEGVEEGVYAPQDVDDLGKTNEGLFGVDLTYVCDVTCDLGVPGVVHVYVMAMMTGSGYFGAGNISSWVELQKRGILPLLWANPESTPPHPLNVVSLTEGNNLAIVGGGSQTLRVRIANAGSATMPFLLILSNIAHNIHD